MHMDKNSLDTTQNNYILFSIKYNPAALEVLEEIGMYMFVLIFEVDHYI